MTPPQTPPKESEAIKFVEKVAEMGKKMGNHGYFIEEFARLVRKARRIRKKWRKK